MTVKGHSSRRGKKVLEFMKVNARHLLRLSRDIAVDVGKKVLEFMKVNARHLL